MKSLKKISLLISFFLSAVLHATVRDSTLIIPYAVTVPVIDGQLDPVWHNVSNIHMSKFVDNIQPENWMDFYTTFRVMFSADCFYVFVHVMDDTIQTDSENPSENDGLEIYIDSNNLKSDSYIQGNDCNWIWVYGDTAGNPGSGNEKLAWFKTDYGYNFELAIPAGDLFFTLEADHEIGFDIQCNDRDNHTRESISKWWSSSNDSWVNPSIFGTATTVSNMVSSELEINGIAPSPKIDGDLDLSWYGLLEIPFNHYLENTDLSKMDDWNNIQMSYRIAYDDTALYLFVNVIDNQINTSAVDPAENDGIELYFDAQNRKKMGSYISGNDVHWRWVYGETGGSPGPDNAVCAWKKTENGYNFELGIPATDLPREYGFGPTIGFEIQVNDNDDGIWESALRWWSESEDSYYNPILFGTAHFLIPCGGPWIWGPDTTNVNKTAFAVKQFSLLQNFPNPFNPTTEISYSLDRAAFVKLVVYDVTGREIATLVNKIQSAGIHKAIFDGSDISSGVYFYKLESDHNEIIKKMILVR